MFLSLNLKRGQVFSLYVANRQRGGDGVSAFILHSIGGVRPRWPTFDSRRVLASDAGRQARGDEGVDGGSPRRASGGPRPEARRTSPTPSRRRRSWRTGDVDRRARRTSRRPRGSREYLAEHRPVAIHRNAAGDFQLMAREHWFELHGYPEFTMYSMNIDGLLGDIAHHAGVREEVLPMPIYHLEHARRIGLDAGRRGRCCGNASRRAASTGSTRRPWTCGARTWTG